MLTGTRTGTREKCEATGTERKSPVQCRQISSSQRVWTTNVWSRKLNTLEHFQGKLWCYQYMLVCSSHLLRNGSGKSMKPWEQAFVLVSGKWEKGRFPFLCRCSGMQLITELSGLEQAVPHSPRVWNKGAYSYPHLSTPSFSWKKLVKSQTCCTQQPRQVPSNS